MILQMLDGWHRASCSSYNASLWHLFSSIDIIFFLFEIFRSVFRYPKKVHELNGKIAHFIIPSDHSKVILFGILRSHSCPDHVLHVG